MTYADKHLKRIQDDRTSSAIRIASELFNEADAQIAALQAEAKQAKSRADAAVRTAQKAMQARDALRAECEALRAALVDIANEFPPGDERKTYSLPTDALDFIRETARAAIDNERSKV